MDDQKGAFATYVFLAVKLLEERMTDLCPFEDWREDVPHYKNLSDELKECGLKLYHEKKWGRKAYDYKWKLLHNINWRCSGK